MELVILLVLGLLLLGGLILAIVGVMRSRESEAVEERLEEFGTLDHPPTLEEIELSQPFTERVLAPLIQNFAQLAMRFTPQEAIASVEHKLELAGRPYGWGGSEFFGLRLLLSLLLGGLGVFLFMTSSMSLMRRILMIVGGVALGYYLPMLWIGSKISRRQDEIEKALPDALDLLTICVEAGLGFDTAMAKVADKWDNELSEAFNRVLQEVQLGRLRRHALRDMADRMEVQDVSTFVAAIIQAEELGVSIAKVLRIQSDQMRMRRRQRAEELARQAPIKMLPAIAFLIFPSIFIILLGPAILKVMDIGIFGGGGGGMMP
jgi:tight adherence protein C